MPQENESQRAGDLLKKEEWEPLLKDESKLSPMMQQYLRVKNQHKGYILFFRLGDFYEMFFDDALTVSRELELTLTGKNCGLPGRAPMCGVPHHSAETYIQRLIEKGYKVAICEQVESPYLAKGVVKREVIRITTPGTVIDSTVLPEGENNYIGSIFLVSGRMPEAGLCFADVSTGEMRFTSLRGQDIVRLISNELSRFSPKELLVNPPLQKETKITGFIRSHLHCVIDLQEEEDYVDTGFEPMLLEQFGVGNLSELNLTPDTPAFFAVGRLLDYLTETQKQGVKRLVRLTHYSGEQYLALDADAVRNLELLRTMRQDGVKGSLLWVLDRTKTAMGKRKMREYLDSPLMNVAMISRRQSAVQELYDNTLARGELSEELKGVYDLQRLMTKVVYGSIGPRDMLALATAAGHLPAVKAVTSSFTSNKLKELDRNIDTLSDVKKMIDDTINPDTPVSLKDGGVIK